MSQQSELMRRLLRLSPGRREELLAKLDASASTRGREAPLTHRQEQLWTFDKVASSSAAYGLGFAITIDGLLDVPSLRAAVDDVLDLHSVLRSVFPHEHDNGVQVVRVARPVELAVEDVMGADPAKTAAEVVREVLRNGFDINRDTLVRFRLLRFAADRHCLVVVSHSLVMDERTADVLGADLARAYVRHVGGGSGLEADRDRTPQFGDYARWQREWVDGPQAEGAGAYWQQVLAGWVTTDLPGDRPRPSLLDLTSASVDRVLPARVVADVRALADRLDVPADDVLLAAFVAVIVRHAGGNDAIVGVPYDVTGPFDPARLAGDCGNLLPLRAVVDGAAPFAALVRMVHDQRRDAESNGALPFKAILDRLRVEPDPGRLPLVQLGFESRARSTGSLTAGGLRWTVDSVDTGVGRFELALQTDFDAAEPAVAVRYATALYRDAAAVRLAQRYVASLTAWVGAPDAPVWSVPFAGADECRTVLERWNAPLGEHRPETLDELFRAVASEHGDRTAIASRSATLTYAELDAWAGSVAARVRAAGGGPGSFVPVLVERGPAVVAAVLGVLRSGAAYVPVDLGQPPDRLASILEDCGAFLAVASAGAAELLGDGITVVDPASGPPEGAPGDGAGSPNRPDSAAYVIYTSGSTGRPKGVVVEHRNLTNFVRTVQNMFGITKWDRVLQYASPGFDVSAFEMFGALLSGALLYVTDDDERLSMEALDRVLAEQRITIIDLPPAVMELLTPERYTDLRVAFVGGEAFSGRLTTRWARDCQFYNGYGPTETTVTVVAKVCEGTWTSSPPIGRAMENHRAYVLAEDMSLAPPGAVGELAIAGLGVARGYLGRPNVTAERFRPDPFGPPGSRMYLTGDLARWDDDGDLIFLGRVDRQVKIRGIRIELGEVEAALQSVDGIARGVADVAVDPRSGSSLLVGYVVAGQSAALQLDSVRAALGDRLPPAMVPNVLVPVDEIPLTASGKVDRRALPLVEFGGPEDLAEINDSNSSSTERTVRTEVFAPLLGARIGDDVNFFAAGGTSLQAIRIASRVKAVFGVEMPIAEFFLNPTVRGLAALVDGATERASGRRDLLAAALDLVEGRSEAELTELTNQLHSGGMEAMRNV